MAATGFTPIQLYSTSTASVAPSAANLTNSTLGSELAINITDGKLFYKDNANAIQVIGWKTTPTTAGGTGLTSYTAGDLLYYATGTTLSKLGIGTNGQILKSTGSAPAWETVSNLAVTSITFGTTGLTPSTATQGAVTVAGTLVAANGGTGQTSYAVGDLLYANTTTTLAKLADVATGNALISGGVGVAPSWGKIGLTTHVNGTLPVGNGGTGQASNLTQYGIIYGSTTTAMATTAAGTSTQVLHGNASGAPTFSAVSLTADVSGTLPVANGGFGNTVGSLPTTTVTFTNLSTSFVDVGTLGAGAVVCISLSSVAGVDCLFTVGMSFDGSDLNIRTNNISGATVAAVGSEGTVIIGGDATRTYTIGRNPSNGYYRIKSSALATGTTTLKYTYFGQR